MFERLTRNKFLLLMDIGLCFLSYAFVILITYDTSSFARIFPACLPSIAVTAAIYCAVMLIVRGYSIYWIYASTHDYLKLVLACMISIAISGVLSFAMSNSILYPKISLASNACYLFSVVVFRFAVRAVYKLILMSKSERGGKKVLIIGAGELATSLLSKINDNDRLNYDVVGLIDDDKFKQNKIICGAKVLGNRSDIPRICKEKRVEEIILAIYKMPPKEKAKMLNICSGTDCRVKIMPGVEEILEVGGKIKNMRDVEIEDLLEHEPVKLDNDLICGDINGKVIFVTGGGGSIGSELCRQIVKYAPKTLIILDIYENTTYELQNELEENYPGMDIVVLIASVRDKLRLDEVFRKYRPDIVFHAAAHKHVPLMEYNPAEAVKNNVFGTYNVALCSDKYGVRRFVMISTDKAVNPTNVMGATKRICEMIVQTMSKVSKTDFVAVRFGNVLGSNGSVIPRFKRQILNGGPVTVTHPEITRFFMTIPEAAQLVLQAASYARGGEIFVLDMGEPVKIYDLARKLISLSGFVPDIDIKIEFTGLRDGEKLYEELLMSEEGLKKMNHNKIYIGKPIDIDMQELNHKLQMLRNAVTKSDEEIKQVLAQVVPTYRATDSEKPDEGWSDDLEMREIVVV